MVDWKSKDFSSEKAVFCAELARLSYEFIGKDRSRLVSSDTDNEYIKYIKETVEGKLSDSQIVSDSKMGSEYEMGLEISDVIITEYFISLLIRKNNVYFLVTRGTKIFNLSDWQVNCCLKNKVVPNIGEFHKNYYKEAKETLDKLNKINFGCNPIYFVGHSLGGAISSILGILWGMTPCCILENREHPVRFRRYCREYCRCCFHQTYSYGRPKCHNLDDKKYLINKEWDVINLYDPIPRLFFPRFNIIPSIRHKIKSKNKCSIIHPINNHSIDNYLDILVNNSN